MQQTSDWMIVTINGSNLRQKARYTLVLSGPTGISSLLVKLDLDTSPVATIVQDDFDLSGKAFIVTTHTALLPKGPGGTAVSIHQFTKEDKPLQASFFIPEPIDPTAATPLRSGVSPTQLGLARFKLRHSILFRTQVPFLLGGVVDVLGQEVEPKPADRVKLPQAPSTKALSNLYIKGDYAAGTGATPAWVLEGKLTPKFVAPFAGWQFYPDIEADIGNNAITNIKFTDSVDFGLKLSREDDTKFSAARMVGLQHLSTTTGFVYETDKELDRDNVLGTANILLRFAHLYESQDAKKSAILQDVRNLPKNKGYDVKPEDINAPALGYELDFSLVAEAGSALKDTTVSATKGNAKAQLPSYSIARVGPQIHGLLELWNLSFDLRATGRYLAVPENTILQLRNNSLVLVSVNAWQGILEGNANWNVDPTKHLALNVTYKNGFSPPKFIRVNTVQAGILLRF